jgi:integrase/recombinase XerD
MKITSTHLTLPILYLVMYIISRCNIIMDTIKKENLVTFFRENNVSEHNQEIVIEYLNDLERIGRRNATILNHMYFLRFMVKTVKTDIDKLTKKDVNEIQDAINSLKKDNGKTVSNTTKMHYKLMLQHFLKQYGTSSRNGALIKLSKFVIVKAKGKKLESENLLTEEEVDRIISCSIGIRDKALISFIYELGARIGEVQNCKMKDVKEHPYGFHITLDGKTGPRQVVLHKNQAWLKKWLENHPNPDDPEAPLFTTTREYNETSYGKNKKKYAKEEPRSHTPLRAMSISYLLKKAARKAGIKKRVYCHLLRACLKII